MQQTPRCSRMAQSHAFLRITLPSPLCRSLRIRTRHLGTRRQQSTEREVVHHCITHQRAPSIEKGERNVPSSSFLTSYLIESNRLRRLRFQRQGVSAGGRGGRDGRIVFEVEETESRGKLFGEPEEEFSRLVGRSGGEVGPGVTDWSLVVAERDAVDSKSGLWSHGVS